MATFSRMGTVFVRTLMATGLRQSASCSSEVVAVKRLAAVGGSNRFRAISSSASQEADPRKLSEDEWLKKLSPEQYYVCREKGTEEPFSGKYYMNKEEGVYTCVCCGSELFSSKTKYDSGTGWPSFNDCVGSTNGDHETHTNVLRRSDNSMGTVRTEVICKKCNCHLGHVFTDGPAPTGDRYCINSVALKFVAKKLA